jgi:hypothetical protein
LPILPRLDNLRVFRTLHTDVPQSLLQTIGRLPALEELVIIDAYVTDYPSAHSKAPVFGPHETAFPALRQLTVEYLRNVDNLFPLYALCGATTLRSVTILDSCCLHRLLPHITPHLVSLCGDFSDIPPHTFHQFVQRHTKLQDLTLYFNENTHASSYLIVDLDPDDLPHLRSFSGPFILYPKVIRACPLTRLALGCHLPKDFFYRTTVEPSLSMLGLTVFPHCPLESHIIYCEDMDDDKPEDWTSLKTIGSSVHELFVRVRWKQAISGPHLGLCFPNIVRLELDLLHRTRVEARFNDIGDLVGQLKSLKFLMIQSSNNCFASTWISPGFQHRFVHRVHKECCPTLKMVAIGPLMVWHLRDQPVHGPECHCDLELLSPRLIRRQMEQLIGTYDHKVYDWRGTLVRLLRECPELLSRARRET